jgi:hypothetical protein
MADVNQLIYDGGAIKQQKNIQGYLTMLNSRNRG